MRLRVIRPQPLTDDARAAVDAEWAYRLEVSDGPERRRVLRASAVYPANDAVDRALTNLAGRGPVELSVPVAEYPAVLGE